MRLKITHKNNETSVSDLDTGKPITGVVSLTFNRASATHAATVTMTLIDETGEDFEVDAEIGANSAPQSACTHPINA